MKKIKITIIFFVSLVVLACSGTSNKTNTITKENKERQIADEEKALNHSSSKNEFNFQDSALLKRVDAMNKERLAQSLVCCGINKDIIDGSTKKFLFNNKPGSIILFGRNIKSKLQLKKLIRDINALYYKMGVEKPFIFVDEEGGRVDRLQSIVGKTDSPRTYYNNNKPEEYVTRISSILNRFGFSSGLLPVLDTQEDGENLIIGDRAFSDNYNEVSTFARTVIKGLKEHDLLAIGKHFPGHGATMTDSHYNLPVIKKSFEELKESDLIPFEKNLDIIDGLMMAHILIPDYSDKPASISKEWIFYVREDLKFNGLILSDDLTMDALKEYGEVNELAYQFIVNGGDICLVCHNIEDIPLVVEKLKTIDEDNLRSSALRVLRYKKQIGIID